MLQPERRAESLLNPPIPTFSFRGAAGGVAGAAAARVHSPTLPSLALAALEAVAGEGGACLQHQSLQG